MWSVILNLFNEADTVVFLVMSEYIGFDTISSGEVHIYIFIKMIENLIEIWQIEI